MEAKQNNPVLHNINIDLLNLLEILLDKSKALDETMKKAWTKSLVFFTVYGLSQGFCCFLL